MQLNFKLGRSLLRTRHLQRMFWIFVPCLECWDSSGACHFFQRWSRECPWFLTEEEVEESFQDNEDLSCFLSGAGADLLPQSHWCILTTEMELRVLRVLGVNIKPWFTAFYLLIINKKNNNKKITLIKKTKTWKLIKKKNCLLGKKMYPDYFLTSL